MDREKIINSIIRVDHAGEYAATYIYKGQLHRLKYNKKLSNLIKEMELNEQEHLKFFEGKINQSKVRPTVFLPLWKLLGFGLGYVTAICGEKYAMACTVAVEETIDEHYKKQIDMLEQILPEENDLKNNIVKIRNDELDHRDIGIANMAKQAKFYSTVNSIISFGCKCAIFLSKKL
jgi:ubiquinone biosynthesis monooxygenase Coq7